MMLAIRQSRSALHFTRPAKVIIRLGERQAQSRHVAIKFRVPIFTSISDEKHFSTSSTPPPPRKEEDATASPPKTEKPPTSILPGVTLSAATATAGFTLASTLSSALFVPISGIPISILLGMTLNNTLLINSNATPSNILSSSSIKPGLTFATKPILQGGIVAVAAKLSFYELLTTGSSGIPVVLASVGAGMVIIPKLGQWMGLPSKMSYLLTAGTSICGVTAITALAPAIKASNRDTAVAVANTVAFGTMGMLLYPYLFHSLCPEQSQLIGMCLGVGIHDTSQVLGSAMSYRDAFDDEVVLRVAAITKLSRNLGLAFALPYLTFAQNQSSSKLSDSLESSASNNETEGKEEKATIASTTMSGLATFQKYVPSFLIAFIGMSTARSCGDYYFLSSALVDGDVTATATMYRDTMNFIGNDVSKYALGTAMAGVGLSTNASSLKGVGWKPFAVGGAGALTVGGVGFGVASLIV